MTRLRQILLVVCACLLLPLVIFAQSTGAKAKSSAAPAKPAAHTSTLSVPPLPYEKYKLKNGLDVILLEDHRLPIVAVNLWYHVGPANERTGLTGFAHLFEHMMFQGSRHVPANGHFKVLEAVGATAGRDINGTTDFDRTNYFETLPSNELEKALWLESDRMGSLLDGLDEDKLTTQKGVVRNERRQSLENEPYGLVEEGLFHSLFPKSHPYYGEVIGSHADVEAAKLNDVREFFKQYYAPNNASLAIVGDISKANVKTLVEKYFGTIASAPPVPKIAATTPPITSERRLTVTDQVQLPRVYMGWITAPIFKPGDADADLLAQILGGGKSSRLYKKLVYEKQIAQAVSVNQQSLMLGSIFEIEATAKPGVKPEEIEQAVDEELEAVRTAPVSAAELERARNTIESRMVRGLETLGGFGGVADRLNQYNHFLGDPGYLPRDFQRYEQATTASLQKFAAQSLGKNQRAVVYGVAGEKHIEDVPKGKAAEAAKSGPPADREPWRAQAPPAGPPSALHLPAPQVFKLANGLTVMLVERHNLPVLAASVYVLAGGEKNPAQYPGLAGFTADMLDEGTARRGTLQIANDADQIGASLSTTSNFDLGSADLRTLSKNADAGFDLLSDVALHPAFDAKELERVRKQRLTSLLQQQDSPNTLAAKTMVRVIYGDKHPYGYLALGTEASLKGMSRDAIAQFWSAHYHPANAALVVAGDISPAQLRALAEKYFGAWKGEATSAELPAVSMAASRRIVIVDKPGAPQTQVRVAELGVPRSTPDFPQIQVMNTLLGGLFSSRINLNLREARAYTYGAFSSFQMNRSAGPFFAGGGIRSDATAPAVKEIFNEFDKMRNTPLSPEELKMTKDFIVHSLPGDFETTGRTVGRMSEIFVYGLPADYYATLPQRIETVTAQDVQSAAQKYVKPESMAVIAVGDRAKIEPELQKLNLGPIEIRDTEANVIVGKKAAPGGQ